MDSLTQIVLGAAVLGKKVGNKSMLYGAIAGTIPDLDVLRGYFVDTVTAIEWHRGVGFPETYMGKLIKTLMKQLIFYSGILGVFFFLLAVVLGGLRYRENLSRGSLQILKSMKKLIFFSGLLGVLLFVLALVLGGFQFEQYSHVQQYISESYATGTPYGPQLRYGLYIPAGIFMALFAFLSPSVLPKSGVVKWSFYGIGIFYGLATIVVSLFPCDTGCNPELINPSISQIIHNAVGALTYLIVPVYMVAIGIKAAKWGNGNKLYKVSLFCGLTAFCLMLVLAQNPLGAYAGLQQRIIEGSILFWIVYTAFYTKKL